MRPVTTALAIVLLAASYTGAQSVCPGNGGLTLTTTGGRLGDPFSLTLSGTPNVSGLLGFDLAGGPVITALGNVCLGLSPAMSLQSFTLDPAGGFGITGIVPPSPPLAGLSVYMQAAANDPTQPAGFALSNGASAALRPPHLHLITPQGGYAGPPPPPPPPGKWLDYDVLTDSVIGTVNLASTVTDQAAVPALGWLVMLLGNNTVVAYDATTMATALAITLPPPSCCWSKIGISGTTLVVLDPGTASIAGSLRAYSLLLGTLLWSSPVPSGLANMIVPSGTANLYLNVPPSMVPFSLSTGAPLPPINLGSGAATINEWVFNGGFLYCLMTGAGAPAQLNAIDTTLQSAVFGTAVPLPANFAWSLRFGPGSAGPSLFLLAGGFPATSLLQISPATLTPTAPPVAIPFQVSAMERSNGGTEWLFVCDGLGCSPPGARMLHVMNAASLTFTTTLGPLPVGGPATILRPIQSASFSKAYYYSGGDSSMVRFNTDPTTTLSPGPLVPYLFPPGVRGLVD